MSTTEDVKVQQDVTMTVFSQQGKNNHKIIVKGGSFWEDVKKTLKSEGYNIDSMRCVENIRRTVLEIPKALIPNEDFNLHLYPVKTKGGAKQPTLNRKEITEKIKRHVIGHGEKAKKYFSGDKSYTNKTTEELDKLLDKWEKKNGSAPEVNIEVKPSRVKASKKGELISGLVDSLEEKAKQAEKSTPAITIKTVISMLSEISNHENQVHIEVAITELKRSLITKPTATEEELGKQEHLNIGAGLQGVIV